MEVVTGKLSWKEDIILQNQLCCLAIVVFIVTNKQVKDVCLGYSSVPVHTH